ncbi:hypothetical protein GV68_21990 [Pseudorhizobium pelagicum]|uniref:Uncharacterized protein n=1 Tax=Pseudorhizobium pelagicum TaxID=1509405 RepID=A0A922NWL2_9HYPH|nr:hypothetical protein GV68_21990 [Pseudorhizobium pelagicum]
MSLHSFDTDDFEMPVMPMACTRSSTFRVDTPLIHASWITATSAFSTVFLGSRKPGNREPQSPWLLRADIVEKLR